MRCVVFIDFSSKQEERAYNFSVRVGRFMPVHNGVTFNFMLQSSDSSWRLWSNQRRYIVWIGEHISLLVERSICQSIIDQEINQANEALDEVFCCRVVGTSAQSSPQSNCISLERESVHLIVQLLERYEIIQAVGIVQEDDTQQWSYQAADRVRSIVAWESDRFIKRLVPVESNYWVASPHFTHMMLYQKLGEEVFVSQLTSYTESIV